MDRHDPRQEPDPRQELARRLRSLRDLWPDRKITQQQLADALEVSVPLISSWESQTSPRIPPQQRLEAYAVLFAARRLFDARACAVPADIGADELSAVEDLRAELRQLRIAAMPAGASPPADPPPEPAPDPGPRADALPDAMRDGPLRFADGRTIKIVCAQWPSDMLSNIPYTQISDPDYIELLTISELDSLFELHGHLRAVNPASQVDLRIAGKLVSDDYTAHLVTLGGVDWNTLTCEALEALDIPVRQVADWSAADGQYFEVQEEDGRVTRHRPVLEEAAGGRKILREDVALFARAVNPFNRRRTVTICNGMYGRGTYGAVRALTDARFRDRNLDYLQSRFGDSDSYCVLTRVPIINGATLTPDWTRERFILFEWRG
jgi:transcriptional regulator with XRE-family HTH domain